MPFPGKDNIEGWGVVRRAPWHLAGIFETKEQAQARAAEMGEGYLVLFGEGYVGSDDFMWSEDATRT